MASRNKSKRPHSDTCLTIRDRPDADEPTATPDNERSRHGPRHLYPR
jgi:hypothetical protein